jgi:Asp-tRNA(Asn)/Glu-tRNA(Gln) amidotransferase A subunit family amidase
MTAPICFFDQLGYEGPMARSVRDAALLLSVQAGGDARAPLSICESGEAFAAPLERDFKGTRIGWLGDFDGYLQMENGVLSLCEKTFADFESLGCHIESVQPDFAPERLWSSWRTLRHWMVAGSLGAAYADPQKRALLKPEACWEVENGLKLSASEVFAASVVRSDWYRAISRLFEKFDLPAAAQRTGLPVRQKPALAGFYRRRRNGHVSPVDGSGDPRHLVRLPGGQRAGRVQSRMACRWGCKSSANTRLTSPFCNWPTRTNRSAAGSNAALHRCLAGQF